MEFFHRPEDPLNQPGYWGTRTSAVDWCEPNYTWSYYIAEFFNTTTSLPAAFLAFRTIYLAYKYGYETRNFVSNMMIALVGIGSAAFHGTLLYTGQIMDELPMVYASLAFLYAVMEFESDKKPVNKYLAHSLIAFALVFTGVYLYLPDFFIFFVIAFICLILTLAYHCSVIFRRPETLTHQKVLIVASLGFYIGGWLFFWIPEVAFCGNLQSLNFHAWWHVTSTFGAFCLVLFTVFQRELQRGRRPQLCYNSFAGVPILPYVHIPSAKEIMAIEKDELRLKMEREEDSKTGAVDENIENRRKMKKKSSVASGFR